MPAVILKLLDFLTHPSHNNVKYIFSPYKLVGYQCIHITFCFLIVARGLQTVFYCTTLCHKMMIKSLILKSVGYLKL